MGGVGFDTSRIGGVVPTASGCMSASMACRVAGLGEGSASGTGTDMDVMSLVACCTCRHIGLVPSVVEDLVGGVRMPDCSRGIVGFRPWHPGREKSCVDSSVVGSVAVDT